MVKAGIDVLCVDTGSDGYPVYINDAKGHGVAMMDGPLERRREDAAMLVHRYNRHEELVKICRRFIESYENLHADGYNGHWEDVLAAKQAIKGEPS